LIGAVAALMLCGGHANADFMWTQKADMPTIRYVHSTSTVGGKIYAIGGYVGSNHTTRTNEYDPMTDTWIRKADMPTPVGYTSTCVLNDKIYVIGGDPSHKISIVQVYDSSTDTWEVQTHVPSLRQRASISMMDGLIYVSGGVTDDGEIPTVEAYDPKTDTWTRRAEMPTARQFATSCVVNGRIYFIGGFAFWKTCADVEEYDPTTDTWTVKAPMPTARCLLDTCVVDGKIYAIGGYDYENDVLISTVEVYDPATDTWTKVADIPIPTEGLSASVVDEKIYVFGGYILGGTLTTGADTSAVYASDIIIDFNADGKVDGFEICRMANRWGTDDSLCDIAPKPWGDGIVDVRDLIVLTEYIGEEVDDPTLISHWPLDEAQGNIACDNAGTCDGTLLGDPVWQPVGGIVNGAIQLDGVDDCILTDSIANSIRGPFSVVAWVMGGAPVQAVLSQIGGANWLCADSLEGNLITELEASGRGATELLSQAIITDGNWHRVGLVWDGSNRTLYVDNVLAAEDTQVNLEVLQSGLYIDTGKAMEPGSFWSGLIDDVRIYNRAVIP